MSSDREKVTKGVMVVLHLSRYSKFQGDSVCPHAMTQQGISDKLGITRQHVTVELGRLQEKGLVIQDVAHISGSGYNRKVYYLSPAGEKFARQLKERTGMAGEEWRERFGGEPQTPRHDRAPSSPPIPGGSPANIDPPGNGNGGPPDPFDS